MDKKIFSIGFVFLALAACSKSGDSVPAASNPQATNAVVLEGTWQGSCTNFSSGSFQSSGLESPVVSDTNVSINTNTYSTADCSGAIADTLSINAGYVSSVSSTDPSLFNVDLTQQSITWTVFDQTTVDIFNAASTCGFSNWTVGVPKDVTNLSCVSGITIGKVLYSIAKVSGTQLQLGQADSSHDGSTPALRHVVLSSTLYQRK